MAAVPKKAPAPSLAQRVAAPAATGSALPASLQRTPRLDRWLCFRADGMVEARSGKVEIGQGILSALAQIVAEELGVPLDRVWMQAASTDGSPDEGVTSGSLSMQESGTALRQACAEARRLCLIEAVARWGVHARQLRVAQGFVVTPDGRRASYAELAGDSLLACDAIGEGSSRRDDAGHEPAEERRYVGRSEQRRDLPAKVYGRPCFIHDLVLDAMLYARVLHGPSPSSTLVGGDEAVARAMPGISEVIRDGNLIGIAGADTGSVDRAAARVTAGLGWQASQALPDEAETAAWLRQQRVETRTIADTGASGPPVSAVKAYRASYSRPFIAHAALAPSCALARFDRERQRLNVWTHSQGIFNLRRDLAIAFALPEDAIVVAHVEGSGCYGHNGADDVAFDAAWLARAIPGRPVRVLWTRADELARSPLGAAMAIDVEADVGDDGRIAQWRQQVWSNGHSSRPGRAPVPTLLGASQTATPYSLPTAIDMPPAAGGGSDRNSIPGYDIGAMRILSHRVLAMPLRTSALRSLGAFANVFAIESFIDEIASATGADPIAFRLRHLSNARARRVIERVAAKCEWQSRKREEGTGFGIGWARYKGTGAWCAVVAEVEAGARIRVKRLTIVVDVGVAVNPDGVVSQIEGGAIQATSWTLKEAVRFDRERILSDSWERYPILRFSEVPAVDVEIVASDAPSLGAGEAALGPTAAAIGNAVHDALGLRMRDLPMTAERIIAAMQLSD